MISNGFLGDPTFDAATTASTVPVLHPERLHQPRYPDGMVEVEHRRGERTSFYEFTGGINYKPHANVVVRPEIRYDWSPTEFVYSTTGRSTTRSSPSTRWSRSSRRVHFHPHHDNSEKPRLELASSKCLTSKSVPPPGTDFARNRSPDFSLLTCWQTDANIARTAQSPPLLKGKELAAYSKGNAVRRFFGVQNRRGSIVVNA